MSVAFVRDGEFGRDVLEALCDFGNFNESGWTEVQKNPPTGGGEFEHIQMSIFR
jgi:hypothetical protein